LAKVDKSQYTKEEWHRIREQRRREKELERLQPKKSLEVEIPQVYPTQTSDKKYTVLCLKHGQKYDAKYVNKLYNMVSKNCTLDYEFVCLTDDPGGLIKDIRTIELPKYLTGWWCKPYMFNADLPLGDTVLYIDLDVVISGSIDKLFTYSPGHWCTVRDFTRAMRPNWHKYNSSVIRFNKGQLGFLWQEFNNDHIAIQKQYFGDQDFLYAATHKNQAPMLYPDSWILSWKWEVRKNREFAPGGRKGKKKLKLIENVTPRVECCVCVFHGDPNPELCEDPWVVDNWK